MLFATLAHPNLTARRIVLCGALEELCGDDGLAGRAQALCGSKDWGHSVYTE